jgi:transcriptional regulator with XRE-family HTH domain
VPENAPKSSSQLDQLAVNLFALRAKANWSTRALAEHCKIDRRTLQRLEHGELNTLSVATVDKVARGLGVRTGSLFGSRPLTRREDERLIEAVLADNLAGLRARMNLTQQSLGEKSGVSMFVIAHIERQGRNPTLETLSKLTDVLGVSMERLLSEPRARG